MKGGIVVMGVSGSGKSTIGPRLARRLDLLFLDTDRSVVARAGMPIDEIFATRGEPSAALSTLTSAARTQ